MTGYCRSCDEMMISGKGFAALDIKTPDQKAAVSYLAVGGEEEFSFKNVTFYFSPADHQPDKLSDTIQVIIEPYDTVEDT